MNSKYLLVVCDAVKKSLTLFSSSFLFRGMIFALNFVVAYFCDKNEFGLISYVRSTAATFEGILSAASSNILISTYTRSQKLDGVLLAYVIYIAATICLAFLIFKCGVIEVNGVGNLELTFVVFIYVSSSLQAFSNSLFVARGELYKLLRIGLVSCVCGLFLAVLAIYILGYYGSLLAYLLVFIVDAAIKVCKLGLFEVLIKSVFLDFSFLKRTSKYFFSSSFALVFFWLIKTAIAMQENGFEQLAEFELIYQFLTIIMIVLGAVSSTMVSRLSLAKDSERILILLAYLLVSVVIVAILGWPLAVYGADLVLLLNSSYSGLDELVEIMIMVSLPFAAYSLFSKFILVMEKDSVNLAITFVGVLVAAIYFALSNVPGAMLLAEVYFIYYLTMASLSLVVCAFLAKGVVGE